MGERAATEVLGFILAFAVITAAIGIIYSSGIGGLQDMRDDEQLQNVERAFDVLAANIEEVRRFGTPSRSTEIRLRNGRLVLRSQSQMTINISDGTSFSVEVNMRPLSYVSPDEDTVITYEGGAVFRASEDQAVMLSDPGWIIEDERLVVPGVVTFREGGPNSLSTAGTALIVAQSSDRIVDSASGDDLNVTVTVNTSAARADAWMRYFQRKASVPLTPVDDDPSDGEIAYSFTVDRLWVVRSIIGLTLSP